MATSLTLGLGLTVVGGIYWRAWRLVLSTRPVLSVHPVDKAGRGWFDGAQVRRNSLPTLHVRLQESAYQALAMQRQHALRTGILFPSDVEWVPARLQLKGQSVPARVRLAGSAPDGVHPAEHWTAYKWGLEVEIDGELDLEGERAFALLSPATRQYLNGWLYAESLRRAGIPGPKVDWVYLSLNGQDWGVYVLEGESPEGPSDLDAELLGRALAHADLWGAGRLGLGAQVLAAPETPIFGPAVARPLAAVESTAAAENPAGVARAYAREAARISQPRYLRALRRSQRWAFARYRKAMAHEFFSTYLRAPWDALAQRQHMLSAALQSQTFAEETPLPSGAVPSSQSPLPIARFYPSPSVAEALARHSFLEVADEPGFLRLRPGDWRVEGDLVLPEHLGLRASEALTLTFERNAALVVRGPLALDGPERGGIHLLPQGEHWGGVLVLGTDANQTSVLNHVEMRGARGTKHGDWKTEGGLTFWNAPVRMERCRVLDTYAPAAVHVSGAAFEWVDSEFGASSGDLASIVDARGSVERCTFHDALGAALRLAGSQVDVQAVSVQRVQGAALRADRNSVVRANGIRVRDAGIAIASTDGAAIHVQGARIGQAHIARFAAYRQGTAHGPATIDASGVVYEDDSLPALVQEGCRVTIDGLSAQAQALEASDLARAREDSPSMRPLHVRFGPSIWLVGYHLATLELAPGETVEVLLYWRAFAYLDRQYTVFVHVRDETGEWVAGWDMMPRYNTFPTTDWPVGERIDDPHIVPLPADLPPGEYTIALGMYYWGTGERLPAYTPLGEAIPEDAIVLQETITVK